MHTYARLARGASPRLSGIIAYVFLNMIPRISFSVPQQQREHRGNNMSSLTRRARALMSLLAFAALGLNACVVLAQTSVGIPGSYQSEAGCAGDWDPGLPRHPAGLRRERRYLEKHLQHLAGRRVRIQGGAQRQLGRELRPARPAERPEHPARDDRFAAERHVLLRPQDALGHRERQLHHCDRARQLPERDRLQRRLGSGLLPYLAAGHQRHVYLQLQHQRHSRRHRTRPRSRSTAAGT